MEQLNFDEKQIEESIRLATSNPQTMNGILNSVTENPEMYAKIFGEMNMDRKAANKLKSEVSQNPDIMKRVHNMSSAERKEMMESMKYANNSASTVVVKGVRITQSNQIKSFNLKTGFPRGTIFETGEVFDIQQGTLVVFTTGSSRTFCKLASMIVGDTIFGEIVIVKPGDRPGEYLEYTVAECQQLKDKMLHK